MSEKYTVDLRISGDASNHVESFVHEIVKQSDDGRRFGVELDVERIDVQEETAEFQKANES